MMVRSANRARWAKSGHADVRRDYWRYSAGPDRQACVRCHSGFGFVDFLVGVPEADRNTTPKIHSCYTCHDPQEDMPYNRRPVASVTFPSGFTTSTGGDALICLNCHQGRTWKGTVETALTLTGSDFSASSLNTHYKIAGATRNRVSRGARHSGRPCPPFFATPGNPKNQEGGIKVLLPACTIHEIRA